MRKLALFLLVVALCLVPLAALAGGIQLLTATRFEFTDCASGGSASQTLTVGTYLMRVTDADVWVCYAATCASGGERFPSGTVMLLAIPGGGKQVTCRSSASTGDVIFTSAN